MGMTKRWLEEEEARGFKSGNESPICSKHFGDYALKQFIETTGQRGACGYCEDTQIRNVVSFDQLMEVIVEGVSNHYGNPDEEGVPYSSEYGYWEKTYDTEDLIRWIIGLDAEAEIVDEVIGAIGSDDVWCLHSPNSSRQSEFLTYDWNLFCRILKHKARYVFFKYPKKIKSEYRSIEPAAILDKIGETITRLNLFYNTEESLFNNLRMYRARQHKRNEPVNTCKEIGPHSLTKAKSANRFSPPGIPMFYGSRKKSTAIIEVIDKHELGQNITTGVFKNIKPLHLIDLTRIPEISIFDLEKAEMYEAAIFLKTLTKKISRKVKKGETQHFEFVPTQVITEYFRHVLPYEAGIKIDGIIYKSSLVKNDDCFVIFADSRNCKDEGRQTNHTVLVLEKNSIERIKVRDFKNK